MKQSQNIQTGANNSSSIY